MQNFVRQEVQGEKHFREGSGCICRQCMTTTLEAKDKRRHEICISMVLPSNTTTQLDNEPSSSGLPMQKKSKKKSLKRLKDRIKHLEAEAERLKEYTEENEKNISEIRMNNAETTKKT